MNVGFVLKIVMFFSNKKNRYIWFFAVVCCLIFFTLPFLFLIIVIMAVLSNDVSTSVHFFPMPNNTYITSEFSPARKHPITGEVKAHYGVDFAGAEGDEVLASAAGRVITVSENDEEGIYIVLYHEDGVVTKYKHLSAALVTQNEAVQTQQLIGLCGNTGVSTGAHLHYELHKFGSAVNPMDYLQHVPEDINDLKFDLEKYASSSGRENDEDELKNRP